jgi:branched-chain amino acid transport system permease protein
VIDRQLQVYERWDAQQSSRICALVTEELIEEHRRKPIGQHSDALERVLQYFRRRPTAGKYVVVMTKPWSEYKVGIWPAARTDRVEIVEDETYATEDEALHAVFLRRVRDLRAATG